MRAPILKKISPRFLIKWLLFYGFLLYNLATPGGALHTFRVGGCAIWKGIDFLDIGIKNGIDFHNFGIRNCTDFQDFGMKNKV